jgi:hypothetical protein
MSMTAAAIWQPIVRTSWWLGVPIGLLGWLIAPRESVIYVSHHPFSIEANPLRTTLHPVLGELLVGYRVTAVALGLMVIATVICQVRGTRAVGILSLLLPVYVAAVEACTHFSSFGRRHHFTSPPTLAELREHFLMAATASVIAVVVALATALILFGRCRAAVTREISWRLLAAFPPLASVVIIWGAAHRLFFGHMQSPP